MQGLFSYFLWCHTSSAFSAHHQKIGSHGNVTAMSPNESTLAFVQTTKSVTLHMDSPHRTGAVMETPALSAIKR